MRKILLIGTGGTIACGHSEDGLKPLLTPEQLLSYVQDSKEFCETDTIQLMNLDMAKSYNQIFSNNSTKT